jgi:hypothetical protein
MTDFPETADPSIEPYDRFTDWYGFDTENDEEGNITLTALVHESGNRTVWKGQGKFVEFCEKTLAGKGKPIVICHNLEYDLVNEFGVEAYSQMQLNYLKGRLISAKMGNITFWDSFNHFRMSLAKIGESLGLKKLDFDINSPDYVSMDAWICLQVMTQARDYIASLGGRIGTTSGSSAMSVWRFMTEDEFVTGPYDTPWARRGYYGGRVEIFRPHTQSPQIGVDALGDPVYSKDIKGYDINSMYPFVMMNDFPEYMMEDKKFEKDQGMAEVTIAIPTDLFVAPLVWRTANGALWYPVGVIQGVWTYNEIRYAESLGAKVLKVHRAFGCNSLVRPFDEFILKLYQKRKESSSEAERLFLKVVMNSLYGKIASKNQVTRTVSRYNLEKNGSKRIGDVKWINYHRGLLDFTTPQQPYVNVYWGAMITANARLLLTDYLTKVPANDLIYCDTDSVYCRNHSLPESKELGGMKLEKRISKMLVVQPKAYQIDEVYRAKGVPKPRESEDGQMVIDFAKQYIEDGMTEFQAPIRFRASLNSRKGKANQWVKHKKSMKSGYTAKILSGDRYFPPVVGEQLDLFK